MKYAQICGNYIESQRKHEKRHEKTQVSWTYPRIQSSSRYRYWCVLFLLSECQPQQLSTMSRRILGRQSPDATICVHAVNWGKTKRWRHPAESWILWIDTKLLSNRSSLQRTRNSRPGPSQRTVSSIKSGNDNTDRFVLLMQSRITLSKRTKQLLRTLHDLCPSQLTILFYSGIWDT